MTVRIYIFLANNGKRMSHNATAQNFCTRNHRNFRTQQLWRVGGMLFPTNSSLSKWRHSRRQRSLSEGLPQISVQLSPPSLKAETPFPPSPSVKSKLELSQPPELPATSGAPKPRRQRFASGEEGDKEPETKAGPSESCRAGLETSIQVILAHKH